MKRTISRRERGIAMVWFTIALIPMLGLTALAIQWAQLTVTQAALQDYVDARAMSAIRDRYGAPSEPIDLAAFIRDETDLLIPARCGGWNHAAKTFDERCPYASGVPAHRVSQAIEVPLLFGSLVKAIGGSATESLEASSTAFIPQRHVVLVQDTSGSMIGFGGIGSSQVALRAIVDRMRQQELPGDHVALVSFSTNVAPNPLGLTPLANRSAEVHQAIDDLPQAGGLTCTATAIQTAADLLSPVAPDHEVFPLIVLVTDGEPSACGGVNAAIAARNAVCSTNPAIQIWAIGVGNANTQDISRFACNDEQFVAVDNPNQVADTVVLDVLTTIQPRIVE